MEVLEFHRDRSVAGRFSIDRVAAWWATHHPVPTIRPMATLLFGNDLTVYANEARVATVSLAIAAIFNRGRHILRLLFVEQLTGQLIGFVVCRS